MHTTQSDLSFLSSYKSDVYTCVTKVHGMLTKEKDICVYGERTGQTPHLSTTTTQIDDDDEFLSTHTQSPTYIYIHNTYRVTDEGNNGHINGNTPQQQQDTFTSLFPTCPPTAPSRNTHTTHLILNYITQDDNCQHSYKDPWPPLPHIVTSYTPYSYTHTPLVVHHTPSHPLSKFENGKDKMSKSTI